METHSKPDQRFRPHERLRDRRDFQRVFERRRAVSDASFVVHATENARDHARLGISVSRKIAKRSVDRHRIKRLVREAFRRNKALFQTGVDFVVVVRAAGIGYPEVEQSLARLARDAARRLGLRTEGQA